MPYMFCVNCDWDLFQVLPANVLLLPRDSIIRIEKYFLFGDPALYIQPRSKIFCRMTGSPVVNELECLDDLNRCE